jgi:type I restriction enzyme R subunit
MELVKQVEVNIDYILMLVAKYHDSNCQDKEILVSIDKAIKSSLELRSKKELIEKFIERVNADTNVDTDWKDFVDKQKNIDLNLIITEQRLKAAETKKFMKNAFRDGVLRTTGNDIDEILPAVSRFGGGNRKQVKATVIEKLKEYFDKYYGLITDDMSFDTKYEYNAGDMGLMMVAEDNKWDTKK